MHVNLLTVFILKLFIYSNFILSVSLKLYNQKEPPVVRVVEGPLFSEVVAYYQHFQQSIRIYNVPGNHTNASNVYFI